MGFNPKIAKVFQGKTEIASFLSRWYLLSKTTLSVEATRLCPLRCIGCWAFRNKSRPRSKSEDAVMSPLMMNRLLFFGRTVGLNKVQFVGGEPLLNPKLSSYILQSRNLGYEKIGVTSSGVAPWFWFWSLIKNGLTDLSFSLDGSCAKTHDSLRPTMSGRSTFFITISNIQRSIKVAKDFDLRIRINHTLYPKNIDEVESMIRLAASFKVHAIRIHYSLPGDGLASNINSTATVYDWLINPSRWLRLVEHCNDLSKELGLPIYVPRVFGASERETNRIFRPGYLQARPDGTLLMCNTHARLPDESMRWFARLTGKETLEVNKKSILFENPSSSTCCKALPLLIASWPINVQNMIKKNGNICCTYLPSPLVLND